MASNAPPSAGPPPGGGAPASSSPPPNAAAPSLQSPAKSKAAAATAGGSPATAAPPKKKKPARRKKPAASGGGGSGGGHPRGGGGSSSHGGPSAASVQAAALRARRDLDERKRHANAIRNDPAWLGPDGIANPAAMIAREGDGGMLTNGAAAIGRRRIASVVGGRDSDAERDAASSSPTDGFLNDEFGVVDRALRYNGMTRSDVTASGYGCLLEQARRYALELIAEAQDYAYHASRSDITPSDLLLASELREDTNVNATLPPPEKMLELSEDVNKIPLPPIPADCYGGVALPDEESCLLARTWDVVGGARVAQRMGLGGPVPGSAADLTTAAVNKGQGKNRGKKRGASYGAGRGRQIPIHLKSSASGDASETGGGGAAGARTSGPSPVPSAGQTPGASAGTAAPGGTGGSNQHVAPGAGSLGTGGGAVKRKAESM